ncbi:hypothetical protein PVL29_002509 [Vitis rotundifolia]|uniref:RING-type E3 ubiquitin transferase n=1 Tax=Vitis rotundifolia TaxID=103349 RepID=A0AA39AHB4_VITRO|nr:hypothetical protein PVL29_002509 [Vitis rotundifolia]
MTYALSPPPTGFPGILPDEGVIRESSSSLSSKDGFSTSNIVTVILILSSLFFVSITLYLLLRYLNRRYLSLNESLPLFTFGSIRGRNSSSTDDCAVCLSKFEPHDQLRLLLICGHAFHARYIDTWLASNQTCPLCRYPIFATEADFMKAILASTNDGDSFRIELHFVKARRSYSVGSFDYIVDHQSEVTVASTHRRGGSESSAAEKNKDDARAQLSSTASISTHALSFRSSSRFFTGSGRRNEAANINDWDLEANRVGEEISKMFRWFSGI